MKTASRLIAILLCLSISVESSVSITPPSIRSAVTSPVLTEQAIVAAVANVRVSIDTGRHANVTLWRTISASSLKSETGDVTWPFVAVLVLLQLAVLPPASVIVMSYAGLLNVLGFVELMRIGYSAGKAGLSMVFATVTLVAFGRLMIQHFPLVKSDAAPGIDGSEQGYAFLTSAGILAAGLLSVTALSPAAYFGLILFSMYCALQTSLLFVSRLVILTQRKSVVDKPIRLWRRLTMNFLSTAVFNYAGALFISNSYGLMFTPVLVGIWAWTMGTAVISYVLFSRWVAPHRRDMSRTVEIIRPEALLGFKPAMILWDFDNTVWEGFPHEEEERLWASWAFETRKPTREQFRLTTEFFKTAQGLNRMETLEKWRAAGYPTPEGFSVFLTFLENSIDAVVRTNYLTGEDYLLPGVRNLLHAFHRHGISQKIVTGGDRDRRWNYAWRSKVAEFFSGIHGGEPKTGVVQRYVDEYGAQRVAVIGDGQKDMEAAKQAGALAIGFAATPDKRKMLIHAGADIIIKYNYYDIATLLRILNVSAPPGGPEGPSAISVARHDGSSLTRNRRSRHMGNPGADEEDDIGFDLFSGDPPPSNQIRRLPRWYSPYRHISRSA